jgi:transcription elongation GreA/GreB family factor
MTAALAITVGLGYVRFVRRGASAVAAATTVPESDRTAHIERRVRELEERMNNAAHALGHDRDSASAS